MRLSRLCPATGKRHQIIYLMSPFPRRACAKCGLYDAYIRKEEP